MIWGQEAPSTSAYSSAAALPPVHTDLIVAATGQLSWDGTNNRDEAISGCANGGTGICYCDRHYFKATGADAATSSYQFVTRSGGSALQHFTGYKKCTYIFTVSAGKGAPAFKLDRADFQAFQLHFFEYPETTPLLKMTLRSATPGFYGDYDSDGTKYGAGVSCGTGESQCGNYYPSPLSNA